MCIRDRILASDTQGNQREISLDTRKENYSWGSSPVIISTSGDKYAMKIHGTNPSSTVIDSESGILPWTDPIGWLWNSEIGKNGSFLIDSSVDLEYKSWVSELPSRIASCSISGEVSSIQANCMIMNGTGKFGFTIILSSDKGEMIDSVSSEVDSGLASGIINLSAGDWSPEPGISELTIRVIDSRGVEVSSTSKLFDVRRTDWNVGLVGLEIVGTGEGQEISILTKRSNQQILDESICNIRVEAGPYSREYSVDMSESSALAPRPKVERPDVSDGVELVATISCEFPWDEDSDQTDNEARIILSGSEDSEGAFSDSSTAIASAILVIGASIAFAWMAKNFREGREMMEKTRLAVEKKALERKSKLAQEEESHREEESEALEESVDEKLEDEGAPSNIDGGSEDFDSFEHRLNRLRAGK